ncbi:SRPBCC family protein [Rhodococcus triatomae]|uniref:Ribosome association toxin PasT (RatA) of the RatAB toxin-antitoxin module n=1 Tax=Rhodococcus triatomae TaxID=300028 RepID=A0A1G8D4Z6_9NOCA|nr:SRPBCC family protein [Rhodococcus triatomae]QNG18508.1 SRPBCC family protein [Rhodococcus triatomae]QNG21823.1 SRPBCC family protein [Rhodococcus triatomae]SDH52795.1 Ribosome association toxin PasT (RatA) of the RatAB toxin-antitoxin module [Rhodococcus triatomae]
MPERTKRSITVDAPPARVMDVIADFDEYPAWVDAATSVEITEPGPGGRANQVRFVLDAGMVKDTYELRYQWAPDGLSVSWELVRGEIQKSQYGSYTLEPEPGGGTTVTYELTVDLTIPMIGLFKRKAEKVITDTALKELKKRVEG